MSDPHAPPGDVSTPPPGWVWDGAAYRWWDGQAWTPHVAPAPSTVDSDDRTLSMIAHAGIAAGGFLLPLIMYLISDEQRRPATRHHAREALNFQLTFLGVYVIATFGLFASIFVGASFGSDPVSPTFGVGVFGLFALVMGLFAVNVVFSVIGAVRAGKGVRWQYPVRIPFVRG